MPRPAIFADVPFDDALETSARDRKLLLVDATAKWCAPCKVMDRTVWSDPLLLLALRERALLIQVDVDSEHAVARKLAVRAMPTVIVYKNGDELDRMAGLQSASQVIMWLDDLERGLTTVVKAKRDVDRDPRNVMQRQAYARALLEREKFVEATDEYVWLWLHMLDHDEDWYGVKHSYLLHEIEELLHSYAPARITFTLLRDSVTPASAPASTIDAARFADWLSLSKALQHDEQIIAWFDATPGARTTDDARVLRLLEHEIAPLLIERERWADAGALYMNPVETLQTTSEVAHEAPDGVTPDVTERLRQSGLRLVRSTAATLVRALRAAARRDDANAVRDAALALDPSEEMIRALRAAETEGAPM